MMFKKKGDKNMEIGDKVIIRDDLKKLDYQKYDIVLEMLQYTGKEAIINEKINEDRFLISIDNYWSWHKDLLIMQ